MKRHIVILSILFICIKLQGQVPYDTIPSEIEFGIGVVEELVIFQYFDKQMSENLKYLEIPDTLREDGKVYISTIFGKNGILKETKVVKGFNPIYDSIAYLAILNLTNWLPAMTRGMFVDMPFVFPIRFDSEEKRIQNFSSLFNSTEEEFNKRKMYFDFYQSDNANQPIINDFEFFKRYLANSLSDSSYVYISEYRSPSKKNRTTIELSGNKPDNKFILIDTKRVSPIYELQARRNSLRLGKNKSFVLIGFSQSETGIPKISLTKIETTNDKTLDLDFKTYTKTGFFDELKKYGP